MKKYIDFDDDGVLKARYDSAINKTIPASAIEVPDALFRQTINETDGQWQIDRATGDIAKHPIPPPTPAEVLAAAEERRAELLASTDWYYVREMKTGQPIPESVKAFDVAVRALETDPDWPNVNWPVLSE